MGEFATRKQPSSEIDLQPPPREPDCARPAVEPGLLHAPLASKDPLAVGPGPSDPQERRGGHRAEAKGHRQPLAGVHQNVGLRPLAQGSQQCRQVFPGRHSRAPALCQEAHGHMAPDGTPGCGLPTRALSVFFEVPTQPHQLADVGGIRRRAKGSPECCAAAPAHASDEDHTHASAPSESVVRAHPWCRAKPSKAESPRSALIEKRCVCRTQTCRGRCDPMCSTDIRLPDGCAQGSRAATPSAASRHGMAVLFRGA